MFDKTPLKTETTVSSRIFYFQICKHGMSCDKFNISGAYQLRLILQHLLVEYFFNLLISFEVHPLFSMPFVATQLEVYCKYNN